MNESFNILNDLFLQTPPKWDDILDFLKKSTLSDDELCLLAYNTTEKCFCEYSDAMNPRYPEFTPEAMYSNHIVRVLRILLENGLKPNHYYNDGFEDYNLMWNLKYIDAPNIAVQCAKLLLEHGADPNLVLPSEGESIFDYITFAVHEDEHTHQCAQSVQLLLLMLAYGGCYRNGNIPIEMYNDYDVSIFKDIELFDWYVVWPDNSGRPSPHNWHIAVYNTVTKEVVANL